MADLNTCIGNAVAGGDLDRTRGLEASRTYDELVQRYQRAGMPAAAAEALAAQDVATAARKAARKRFHATVTQLRTLREIEQNVLGAPDPAIALRALIEYSDGTGYTGKSVESLRRALVQDINFTIRQTLERTGRNMVGRSRDKAMLRNVWRELYGQASGDPVARELADAVGDMKERLRVLFNQHGGDIGKLENHGVTQTHDAARIERAKFPEWRDFIFDRLDWAQIPDLKTGKPFAARGAQPDRAAADRFLQEVYENITSDGWSKRSPTTSVGGKALYNQRADHRVLHFKDADAAWDYNQRFGAADPFSAIVGQLHGMARDIAQMEVLGPNPRLGLEYAIQLVQKRAGEAHAAARTPAESRAAQRMSSQARRKAALVRAMLAHVDGSANVPVSTFWASFFGGTRNLLTSAQLGAATLSAVTDAATIRTASAAIGLNPANVLSTYTRLMASKATRETAAQMGYIAETLANSGAAAARYLGDTFSPEITGRLADFTLRASGLAHHTDMAKTAFRMEFAGYMASQADRAFADLDPPLRKLFTERGITPGDWDALRAADTLFEAPNGSRFLSPLYWRGATDMPAELAEDLSQRLQMVIEEQIEFAVPSASIEGRAQLMGAAQPGTFYGELLRSGLMYKSFALSLTLNQYRRIAAIPTPGGRARYAAGLVVPLFALGALAVQLKEMSKGRDPRPMDDPKFALAAFMQSGGAGIFGDFFYSETSRAGGGLAETLSGPVVGLAGQGIRAVASNVQRSAEGKDILIGRDVANFVRQNTPVASSLWYSRLAFDRMVADELQRFLDPEAEQGFRRAIRRADRDFDAPFWWEPGTRSPQRSFDLSNVLRAAQ